MGQFVVGSAAVPQLSTAVSRQIDLVQGWAFRARGLDRLLPTGDNPVGAAMSETFSGRAGALASVLDALRTRLEEVDVALRQTSARYEQMEEQGSRDFDRIAR